MICADGLKIAIMGALMIAEFNEEYAVKILVKAHRTNTCTLEL